MTTETWQYPQECLDLCESQGTRWQSDCRETWGGLGGGEGEALLEDGVGRQRKGSLGNSGKKWGGVNSQLLPSTTNQFDPVLLLCTDH